MLTQTKLSWGLHIATLNRIDALETCLRCALTQSRQPAEIVVVDASADWREHEKRCSVLLEGTSIRLVYLEAPQKSTAVQRNLGISSASTDICFLIDDDSFMYPDCAEQIMQIYEHPSCQNVLAVAASDGPPFSLDGMEMPRKPSGVQKSRIELLRESRLFRFFWREIALMSHDKLFVPYDGPYQRALSQEISATDLSISSVSMIAGYKLTARRAIAEELLFEKALQSYSPAEDLDFTYRISRSGYLVCAHNAKLYHHEIATSRVKRRAAILLSVTNVAYFVRTNATHPFKSKFTFAIMLMRRLLAEFIKDVGSRRWGFEQFRAVIDAIPVSAGIFTRDINDLPEWYREKQLQILSMNKPPLTPTHQVKN